MKKIFGFFHLLPAQYNYAQPLLVLAILFTSCFPASKQENGDARQDEIVFLSVSVIPMDRERILENQAVVVKDGKITEGGDLQEVK